MVTSFVAGLMSFSCQRDKEATIDFGEIVSLTGKEAAWGQASHQGAVLAIEQLNAAGGILGKRIELLTEDNQSKPGETATITKKLISRHHVIGILGEDASSRSLEAAPICQAGKIPMICSSSHPGVTETGDYVFRTTFTTPFEGRILANFARNSLRLRRVAVLSSASAAYSIDIAKWFKDRFIAVGGEVVLELKYFEGDKDFKAQLTAIKASSVDAIFVPANYMEAALICVQARELGLSMALLGCAGWEAPALFAVGGTAVEGCYYATAFSDDDPGAVTQKFVRDFRARYNGQTPDAFAGLRYDAAMLLAAAIRQAGTSNPQAIRDALAATKDFPGVTGTITMDAKRDPSKAVVIVKVENGQPKFVARVGL
ncbi:MAG: ABC transporter substrate-binding protein [Opitutaceae bacterium]